MTGLRTSHPSDDQLFELAHGLGLPTERDVALVHLHACESCARRFAEICGTRERVLAEGVPSFEAVEPERVERWSLPWRPAALAAAAVAAMLALGLGLPWLVEESERAPRLWLPTSIQTASTRGEDPDEPHRLREGLALYEARELGPAIESLREIDARAGWADVRDVFLASALANAERFEELEPVLARLRIATLPYEYRQSARWYRYLMYAKTHRPELALAQLRELAPDPGVVGERARAELQRLEPDQGRP